MPSPCLTCDFKDEDKNKERCANCEKRIKYAMQENLISIEAVEADLAAREETRKILGVDLKSGKKKTGPKPRVPKEAVTMEEVEDAHRGQIEDINETQMGIDMADLKAGESTVKKRGWPKGRKRGPRVVKTPKEQAILGRPRQPTGRYHDRWNLRIAPLKTDTRVIEILEELWKIANIEYRKPSAQALIFIINGIEKWKKEHKEV